MAKEFEPQDFYSEVERIVGIIREDGDNPTRQVYVIQAAQGALAAELEDILRKEQARRSTEQ